MQRSASAASVIHATRKSPNKCQKSSHLILAVFVYEERSGDDLHFFLKESSKPVINWCRYSKCVAVTYRSLHFYITKLLFFHLCFFVFRISKFNVIQKKFKG